MNDWLGYFLFAVLACGAWLGLGYLVRISYDKITEGRR
jgi:hypothetical protein